MVLIWEKSEGGGEAREQLVGVGGTDVLNKLSWGYLRWQCEPNMHEAGTNHRLDEEAWLSWREKWNIGKMSLGRELHSRVLSAAAK